MEFLKMTITPEDIDNMITIMQVYGNEICLDDLMQTKAIPLSSGDEICLISIEKVSIGDKYKDQNAVVS
jgi:hypothetical protein